MARITLKGFRCERCSHEWVSRNKEEDPRVCPKCKSPYWDTPKKQKESTSLHNSNDNTIAKVRKGANVRKGEGE